MHNIKPEDHAKATSSTTSVDVTPCASNGDCLPVLLEGPVESSSRKERSARVPLSASLAMRRFSLPRQREAGHLPTGSPCRAGGPNCEVSAR